MILRVQWLKIISSAKTMKCIRKKGIKHFWRILHRFFGFDIYFSHNFNKKNKKMKILNSTYSGPLKLKYFTISPTWGWLWSSLASWSWPWPPWRCWCWGWWVPSWSPGAGSRSYSKSPGDLLWWDAFTFYCSLNSYRIIFFWNLTTVLLKIVLQLMQSFLLSLAALSSI